MVAAIINWIGLLRKICASSGCEEIALSGAAHYSDYLDLNGDETVGGQKNHELVSASFIIPYPPGFPILVPGHVISQQILAFMRALDVNEIYGYRRDLRLRVITKEALEAQAGRAAMAAE